MPFCDLTLRTPKPLDRAYPTELQTIGDHVRKRRLDLGLTQQEVALMMGVNKTTIFNWEAGRVAPDLHALPEVLKFLGYDPRPQADTFPERIRQLRQGLGLSLEELAAKIGVDPSTIQKWERLGFRPRPRLFARLAKILSIPEPPEGAPLGDRLRARRLALGLTQAEAEAQIGVSQDTLSRWELGRIQPQGEKIRQTRSVLGIETSAAEP
ncbi:MAG: transcriptional regulator [Candidatus Eisenbacteria bacterium]|uniref:Transcriptional regulator n=1 Tax=Eiseniibacteriota bacterium TaxID=2212470 RepID=A0A948RZG1_UNCEI|nr:transcriptional regulator [Candidatus Eisenbacteria bacterium]MBU1949882.1 transcriptional regulator [Candidatus Eisenbacteria bacterium]MBU2692007.1 transcriptional regulator [Candidatus Eisenbacteria bacterium]